MNKHRSNIALSFFLLLAASGGSSAAQQSPSEAQAGIQCGGQYECIEDRPLSEAEARASRGYPLARPQEPAQVAATQPAARASVVELREERSSR